MTTRTAVGPLRRSLAGARAVGAAPTYTTTGDTTIRELSNEFVRSYEVPKTIRTRLTDENPIEDFTIHFNKETGQFGFVTGLRRD